MVARTLITTADEHTWPKDESEPVIFLGEWCKIYSNKEKWEKFDSVTAQYHWDDRKKLHKDFVFLQEVYEKYLLIISNKMNKIHSVSYTVRYWRILMGPWLGYFIQIIYDRLMMIEEVYDKHDVLICNIIDSPYCVMVPQDMNDFVDKIVGDEWNQWVYKELIKFRGETSYNILREEFQVNGETNDRTRGKIKSFAKRALNSLSFLSANNKYFFISSYLSVSKQVHLELLLGQVPSIYRSSPIIPNIDIDKHCRDQLVFDENETYFESFLSYLLPLQIPAIYLENYEKLINEIEKVRWPTSPENILTANAHYFDDFFKAWSAGKVEKECKLTIIQHGGLRWTSMWSFHEEHERKICDNYFSWGVECSEDKAIRALPSGKIMSNKNKINHSPSGGLLQVVSTLPRYSYHLQAVPVASQQQIYEDEQIIFAQGLRKDILKKLTVRLSVADWGWEQAERWKENFNYVNLELPSKNLYESIGGSRLFIGTYNATTFLETLASNCPTILFWNPEYWELNSTALKDYEELKRIGILFDTPEEAADQVNKVWDNVDQWWLEDDRQEVVKLFCNKYVKTENNWLHLWRNEILLLKNV